MKTKFLKLTYIFVVLIISFIILNGALVPVLAQDTAPKSVIINFGKDTETQRNFTWFTSTTVKKGMIEYCIKNKFISFESANIIKVIDKNYETKNNLEKRMIHKVELTNLEPGKEYLYRVGDDKGGFSPQGEFKTAEQNLNKFTFINITDTQGTTAKDYSVWKNTLDKALDKFPDARFLLHTGDMVDVGQEITQWDLFTNAVKTEFMNLPITPVVGNHEVIDKNNSNFNAKNFTDRFNLSKEQDTGAPLGTVYSFDYGNVHFAVMNTQCGSGNLKKQADWLRVDMTKSHKLWKIVALHRGPYGATYDTTDIRKAWTPVFDELGIDLVLQGHDHNYVRSYPIKNNTKVKTGNGTIYMVGNTGGVKFYPQKSRSWQAVDMQPYLQMYIAVAVDDHKMTIDAYNVKNILLDSFTLKK